MEHGVIRVLATETFSTVLSLLLFFFTFQINIFQCVSLCFFLDFFTEVLSFVEEQVYA